MQKSAHPNIPPHHRVIIIKIQENLLSHKLVARVDVAQVANRDEKEIVFGDAYVARNSGAEDAEESEEEEDIANCIGKDKSAVWNGPGGRGELACYELCWVGK